MLSCRWPLRRWWLEAAIAIAVAGCAQSQPEPQSDASSHAETSLPAARTRADADGEALRTGPAATVDAKESRDARLVVLSANLAVYATPSLQSTQVGAVRAGGVLRLGPGERTASSGACSSGFYALHPRGFVCADHGVTQDLGDARARLLTDYTLASGAALPASHGVAAATPLYARIPTLAEQARAEPGIDRVRRTPFLDVRSAQIQVPDALRTAIIGLARPKPLAPDSPVVGALANGARVAWVAEFDEPNRSWLLTPELLFVASDRVSRAAISGFHGIDVPHDRGVAFVGHQAVPRYVKSDDSQRFVARRQSWLPLTPVLLAEPTPSWSEEAYLETVEPGVYLRANEVIVAHPTPPSRWGLEPNATFIEIVVATNLLLLHRGDRVTFATLASVGRGSTLRGKFRLFSKSLTAPSLLEVVHGAAGGAEIPSLMRLTDTPERPNETKAVPLYAAWWASRWGSAAPGIGVALAPLDARRILDETEPTLPEGWHSVRGDGTWVVIRD